MKCQPNWVRNRELDAEFALVCARIRLHDSLIRFKILLLRRPR
jgi:hypothetical protein